MDTEAKMIVLGAYIKGVFDSAASRGVLTNAAEKTMLNALVALYGKDKFVIEDPPAVQSAITASIEEAQKEVAKRQAK